MISVEGNAPATPREATGFRAPSCGTGLCFRLSVAAMLGLWASSTSAQRASEPRRTRVALGPQLVPVYPGSSDHSLRPFVDVSRTRGNTPFAFEAADESIGFPVLNTNGFATGPSLGFQGSRTGSDVGADLQKVGTTVEVGAFVQYQLRSDFRMRLEGRRGLGGHQGWLGIVSADYVTRRGDDYLFAIGPRVTLADGRYHRAYFGVAPQDSAPSGLRAFRPGGGVQAVGAAATALRQITPRWGVSGYARYDRLAGDAERSPIVRAFGSRIRCQGASL